LRDKESSKVPLAVLLILTVLGSAFAYLPTPVFAQNPSCGDTITTDTTLTADIGPCSGDGLIIGANGITLDCAGHNITGTGIYIVWLPMMNSYWHFPSGDGIRLNGTTQATIKNCRVYGFSDGIRLISSSDNDITGNSVVGNVYGFALRDSSSNTLTGNTGNDSWLDGFLLVRYSFNTITGNTADGNGWSQDVPGGNGPGPGGSGFVLVNSSWNILAGNTASYNGDDSAGNGFSIEMASDNNTFSANTANHNTGYGYADGSKGSGTAGTANRYSYDICHGNIGNSRPSGICLAPFISLSRSSGYPGISVTITGGNFLAPHSLSVTYDGSSAGMPTCSIDAFGAVMPGCVFTVPPSLLGPHTVRATDGTDSPTAKFTVPPTITTTLSHLAIISGQKVFDSATLKGRANPVGTVTYEYFASGTCSGTPTKVAVVKIAKGVVPNSGSHVFSIVGSYGWKAVYSGDKNQIGATSPCERLTVLPVTTPPTHTTVTCTKSSFAVGTRVTCMAVVTGSYSLHTGTITWSSPNARGVTFSLKTCTLMSGRCWVTIKGTIVGSVTIKATYSGDPHNPWSYGTKVLTIT
jgi:parallel beta-helix repeat protein